MSRLHDDYMLEAAEELRKSMKILEAKQRRLRRWLLYPALFLLALWVVGKITLWVVYE